MSADRGTDRRAESCARTLSLFACRCAGVEILTRVSSQAVAFAAETSPQTVYDAIKSLPIEDVDLFSAWAIGLLNSGMQFPIAAGHVGDLLHSLLIDGRVRRTADAKPSSFLSDTTGQLLIHRPAMEV